MKDGRLKHFEACGRPLDWKFEKIKKKKMDVIVIKILISSFFNNTTLKTWTYQRNQLKLWINIVNQQSYLSKGIK